MKDIMCKTSLGGLSLSILLVIIKQFYCIWQYTLTTVLTFMLDKVQA